MNRSKTALPRNLEEIETAARSELLAWWQSFYQRPAPKGISSKLLKRAIAYEWQVKKYGGLKPATKRMLKKIALGETDPQKTKTQELSPGNRLHREWHGRLYTVDVTEDGFVLDGKSFRSLSEVARRITGARWNGPRFFGLRSAKKEAAA